MKNVFRSKWTEYIVVTLFALLLTVIFTWPATLHINSSFMGDGGDNYEYASYIGLASQNLRNGNLPFFHTTYWRYPVGFDFARGFDSYLTVSIGMLLHLILNLTLSYNLTIFALMILNGVISYAFFTYLTRSKILGILGMIMYGFSFYTLAKAASHPNLLFIGALLCVAYTTLRLFQKSHLSLKDFLLFFSSLLFVALGSTQYLIFSIFFTLVFGVLFMLINKGPIIDLIRKVNHKKYSFLGMGFLTFVFFLILFSPHIGAILGGQFVLLKRQGTLFELTPSLLDYILPNRYLKLIYPSYLFSTSLPSIEKAVFIGWMEILLFVLFFFSKVSATAKKVLFAFFFVPFVLSMGYGKDNNFFLLPYHFLSNVLPFSALVETGRYVIIFSLITTIAILFFLKSIRSQKLALSITILCIGIAIAERLPHNYYESATLSSDSYVSVVANTNTAAVLDFPVNYYYASYNILSLSYGKPIVNGYFHWSADGKYEKSFISENNLLSRFICSDTDKLLDFKTERTLNDQMIALLKQNNISTLVIHKDDKFYHPVCRNVRTRIDLLIPTVQVMQATQSDREHEIVLRSNSSKPEFTLYFPQKGTFFIGGVYIAPTSPAKFILAKNGIPADGAYSWNVSPDNSMQLEPQHTLSTPVDAGTKITFSTKDTVESTYFSLWYIFTPDIDAATNPYGQPLEKIFEDEKAAVYRVN